MTVHLTELWIYPLKSARGLRLQSAEITSMGLKMDRRWMLVDESGRFLSQRDCPAMARLLIHISTDVITFEFGTHSLTLPMPPYVESQIRDIEVGIWHSRVKAQCFEDDVGNWFTRQLGRPCRLVFMPESTYRRTNPGFAPGKRVSFADGYPFLLCNQTSLDELNQRLKGKRLAPVTMDRFRPNLVIRASEAFAEDQWKEIEINGNRFNLVKPCERCVMISTDQQSGLVSKEPLRTLAEFRKINGKVIFGQNLTCQSKSGQLNADQICDVFSENQEKFRL